MAEYILHKSDSRGNADHGWLKSRHTFSFAGYFNPERMRFGMLRVLNDDYIAGGMGFDPHPHDNMEIISIPLEGDLEHKDSMGNISVIRKGDIQVMSAGVGIIHSEYNKNKDQGGKFLQIWVYPNKRNVQPRYDQITYDLEAMHNDFLQVLSPNPDDAGVWIYQDAWFHLSKFDAGFEKEYTFKNPANGLYIFVIDGFVTVDQVKLNVRDGLGVIATDKVNIKADSDAEILLMEVPLA